jgi:hypothetical protein
MIDVPHRMTDTKHYKAQKYENRNEGIAFTWARCSLLMGFDWGDNCGDGEGESSPEAILASDVMHDQQIGSRRINRVSELERSCPFQNTP